ncbi:TPA: hypothetical protein ACTDLJ_004456 [Salmonella enterica subsp. enterica serovar Newport]|nr:hypothetical protein [Salmonella enterica]
MKKIIIISPCSFTQNGFSNLVSHERMSDVKIINAGGFEETLSHAERSGPSIIIVDMTIRIRKFRAKQLANIWNLRRAMYTNEKLRKTPCFLFGIKNQSQLTSLHWISSQNSVESLIDRLVNIFQNHEEYSSTNNIKQKGLEKRQRIMLEQLMSGCSIKNISIKMNSNPHSIFYSRDRLIVKFGLNDRYDFIALSTELIL